MLNRKIEFDVLPYPIFLILKSDEDFPSAEYHLNILFLNFSIIHK